mmetsp:Transcript_117121/g.343090  ORF Transcript_117121/g.343090 Transcript_117121/m.343090 type:complete len:277 (-) Transcript_117121:1142-1972(-)
MLSSVGEPCSADFSRPGLFNNAASAMGVLPRRCSSVEPATGVKPEGGAGSAPPPSPAGVAGALRVDATQALGTFHERTGAELLASVGFWAPASSSPQLQLWLTERPLELPPNIRPNGSESFVDLLGLSTASRVALSGGSGELEAGPWHLPLTAWGPDQPSRSFAGLSCPSPGPSDGWPSARTALLLLLLFSPMLSPTLPRLLTLGRLPGMLEMLGRLPPLCPETPEDRATLRASVVAPVTGSGLTGLPARSRTAAALHSLGAGEGIGEAKSDAPNR